MSGAAAGGGRAWERRVRAWTSLAREPVRKLGTVTEEELAKHNSSEDCWIAVSGEVFDVSRFLAFHPGGPLVVAALAGRNCTEEYSRAHRGVDPMEVVGNCHVGRLVPQRTPFQLASATGLFKGVSDMQLQVMARQAAGRNQQGDASDQSLEAVFALLDEERNGVISPQKLASFLKSLDATPAEVEAVMIRVNKPLTRKEFINLVHKM